MCFCLFFFSDCTHPVICSFGQYNQIHMFGIKAVHQHVCCSKWSKVIFLFQLGKTLDGLVTSFRPTAQMVSIAGKQL